MPSANHWNDHLALKIVNVAVFVFLFSSGLYSAMSPSGHGGKETYITPAPYVFQTWTLIDLLLLGYVVYQFFDSSHDAIHAVGWRFALVGVLNAIFLHTYVTHHLIVAFIFSLFTASTVSTVYYTLSVASAKGLGDVLFVHTPWSLWHAWSIVTVFISGFAAFTHGGHGRHPSVVVKVLVVLSCAFFAITAWGYAFRTRQGDIAGAIVLAWTLFGVYDEQHNKLIHYFALACFIVSLFAIVKSLYFTFVARDSGRISLGNDERAPLVA
ncbi:hypothetical protein ACM66B_004609 [Microbotryomycetes sp. NB124-2]